MNADDRRLSDDWPRILREKGVIQEFGAGDPHVMYEGGKIHSDFSFNINALLADQPLLDSLLGALLEEWRMGNESADAVCSHTPYGGPLAETLGKIAGKPAYLYRSETSTWENGGPAANSSCIVVGDDVLTGGRLTRLVTAVRDKSARVLEPAIVLADLTSDWKRDFAVLSGVRHTIHKWSPEDCPLCRRGSSPMRRIDLMHYKR
jgi:hypothetical protein